MKGATRSQVYAAIDGERDYQDSRWNSSTTESGGRHSVAEFYLYIEHYLAAGRAALSTQGDPKAKFDGLDILRKVTAMGVACMEQNGIIERDGFERFVPDIDSLDLAAVALNALARHGIPVDVQTMLVAGDGRGTVPPRALTTAIKAVIEAFWKKVSPVIADPDNPPHAVDIESELRRLDVVSSTRQEAMRRAYLVGRSVQAAIQDAAMAAAPAACPEPDKDSDTYYRQGKDGPWFEALDDKDFAAELSKAAQDLNDTGLGDDLDKWMPFQVMLASAAERIQRGLNAGAASGG